MSTTTLPLHGDRREIDPGELESFQRRHPIKNVHDDVWWRLLLVGEVLLILTVWEVAVSVLGLIRPTFLPPPTAIGASLVQLLTEREFLANLGFSLSNLAIGVALACTVGIVLGIAVGWFRLLNVTVGPLIWVIYSTPKAALAPLIILWLGLGPPSKILLVFLLSVFPILLNTIEGIQTVDPSMLRAGRVYGARGLGLARKVIVPATFPFVLVGLRRGIALGFIGEMLGEFLGGSKGLGHLLLRVVHEFLMDDALAIVVVMVVVANAGLVVLDMVRKRFAPWYTGSPTRAV